MPRRPHLLIGLAVASLAFTLGACSPGADAAKPGSGQSSPECSIPVDDGSGAQVDLQAGCEETNGGASNDGASSGAPSAGPAVHVDACSLLTADEAERLAGTPLAKPAAGTTSCTWAAADPAGRFGQVEVYVGDGAKKQLDLDRTLDHELTSVPGIGEEAWQEADYVFFRVGTQWFSLHVVRLDDPAEYAPLALQLAATMASRV